MLSNFRSFPRSKNAEKTPLTLYQPSRSAFANHSLKHTQTIINAVWASSLFIVVVDEKLTLTHYCDSVLRTHSSKSFISSAAVFHNFLSSSQTHSLFLCLRKISLSTNQKSIHFFIRTLRLLNSQTNEKNWIKKNNLK